MEKPVRQRAKKKSKPGDVDGDEMHKGKMPDKHSRRWRKSYMLYLLLLSISSVIIGYQILYTSYKVNTLDHIGYGLGIHTNKYAVIIDAGSTGSRVLALSFYKSGFDGSLKLEDDLFVQNKPGLSSFAKNPKKGAEKVRELLEKAEVFIPKHAWKETPVALRATAGLRLLPSNDAINLLNEVQNVINQSPFLSDEKSVSIMDGKDEGLFSWFTVNFLLDHLKTDTAKTVVTLDLGGGSVQITFVPGCSDRIIKETPGHLYRVSIMNKKVDAYSYSYLGLGLMAARRRIFLEENPENTTDIKSSCLHSVVKSKEWYFGGQKYSVSGSDNDNIEWNIGKCYEMIKRIVESDNVDKPSEMFDHEIVAFSYFFERAAQADLVDPVEGGIVTINEFNSAADKACRAANAEHAFACLDLKFIASLLEHGFGIKPNTPIKLMDTVDGHEISWGLGAAYQILESN